MPSEKPETTSRGPRVGHVFSPNDELALLVDAVQDYGLMVLSPTGEIRSWNRGANRVFGYDTEEVIGVNFSVFYPPEDLENKKPQRELEIARRTGRIEDEGWRIRKDGTRFWVNTIITALHDESGTLIGFGKVTRDLTARREADEKIRQSEEVLRLIVDAVQDYALMVLSPTGEIRSWNRGGTRVFGYEEDEAIGRNFSMFYSPEDIAARKPQKELEVALRDGRIEDEGWRIRKDGARFWVNTIITPLYDETGHHIGFSKVTRDLTLRREAEEKLRQSEEMFRLLVSSVRDYAIFLLDPEGRIATWNTGAQRIKGYTPTDIIGKHFSIFYPPEDIAANKPERELAIAREKGVYEEEGWRLRKDGSRFWANVVITAVFDSHRVLRGYAKVTRDITERKEAEETARALLQQREARLQAEEERRRTDAAYRAAQEANRAKDEFLMTLSHELRTPMTAILGWSRLLPTLAVDDDIFREAVASIARSAEVQATLIDDVLDLSRIVSGKLRLTVDNVDVTKTLEAALQTVRPSADAKGIRLVTDFDGLQGTIVADATRLQQVIWNLLSNAVKFTPRGGQVTTSARQTASKLQIKVTDTGEGIAPSFLPHVFEPFRQAENPSTRVHGGLGLGLSIVRYIVEAHGGEITADSEGRGKGATFSVTLPIRSLAVTNPAAPWVATAMAHRKIQGHELKGVKILILDDDREGREMVKAVLRSAGATVMAAATAREAFEELARQTPDVIISDIAMPEIDGFAFERQLHATPGFENIKVIALTAFPRPTLNVEKSAFAMYLSKPIDPFDLVDSVAKAFRS
jgi:PAS domain S-box-containing protein